MDEVLCEERLFAARKRSQTRIIAINSLRQENKELRAIIEKLEKKLEIKN